MPRSPDILSAGDSLTAAGLLAARNSVKAVIGAGGAAQGVQGGDPPGPIPNGLFLNTTNILRVAMTAYIATAGDGPVDGFAVTALVMPFSGTLLAITAQTDTGNSHELVVARESGGASDGDSKVVTVQHVNAGAAGRCYSFAVAETPDFKIGDTLIIATYALGDAATPAVGDKMPSEELVEPGSWEFWFMPTEEPT